MTNKKNQKEMREEKYETKCVFCDRVFLTIKDTANEGICYSCRCGDNC